MYERKCQLSEDDRSQSLADNYEKYLKIQDGIKHTAINNPEPKLEIKPFIIGKCTDCDKEIYSDKGSLTLTRKGKSAQLFCNRRCAINYHNTD